jgi:hypothetical protein
MAEPSSPASDKLRSLRDYAVGLGIEASIECEDPTDEDYEPSDPGTMTIYLANGRNSRAVRVFAEGADVLLGTALDQIVLLGDYSAYHDRSTGLIEARVIAGQTIGGLARSPRISNIPGAEPRTRDAEADDDIETPELRVRADHEWQLRIQDPDSERSMEVSALSDLGSWVLGTYGRQRALSLKLAGESPKTHDEALRILESASASLFFDLDVLYNLSLGLIRPRHRRGQSSRERSTMPPPFPKNVYASEAIALYQYGREAASLPLLEFLAYYQALEYFFPSFAHAKTTAALRSAIMNPRFDPSSDEAISSLIDTAAPAVRAGIGEREQLRATLDAAVTRQELRDVIEKLDEGDHFTAKRQSISGLSALRPAAADLLEQVVERTYSLRCRIVHTKQDGGPSSEDLLLPSSPDVKHLGPEIALLRYVAQEAIVARAKRA